MKDDAELLSDYAQHGAEAAFTELVQRHLPLVYSAALRLVNGDTHLAQEVAQRVFTDLSAKAALMAKQLSARREALPGWLYTSTRFAAATAIRAAVRRRRYEEKAAAMGETIWSPDQNNTNWETLRPAIDNAMSQLSVADRDAVILRFFQGEELRTVGEVLGVSEDAARMRINRALERLRGLLSAGRTKLTASALASLISTHAVEAAPPALAAVVAASSIGATAGTGITLLSFMTMTKLKTAALCALIIVGAGTPLILQHRALERMRQENARLAREQEQLARNHEEIQRLNRLVSEVQNKNRVAQPDHLELMRLRGEVGLLRRDSQELGRLRSTAKDQLSNRETDAEHVLLAEAWSNVGFENPLSALETFFWAGRHGQSDVVGNVIRWDRNPSIADSDELANSMTNLISSTAHFIPKVNSLQILDEQAENASTTRMRIALALPDGKRTEANIRLVKENDSWYPLFHVWKNQSGDLLATMDIPPSL